MRDLWCCITAQPGYPMLAWTNHWIRFTDANRDIAQISNTPERSVKTAYIKKLISLPFQSKLRSGEEHIRVISYLENNPKRELLAFTLSLRSHHRVPAPACVLKTYDNNQVTPNFDTLFTLPRERSLWRHNYQSHMLLLSQQNSWFRH